VCRNDGFSTRPLRGRWWFGRFSSRRARPARPSNAAARATAPVHTARHRTCSADPQRPRRSQALRRTRKRPQCLIELLATREASLDPFSVLDDARGHLNASGDSLARFGVGDDSRDPLHARDGRSYGPLRSLGCVSIVANRAGDRVGGRRTHHLRSLR
jgi:hypothetical protein